METILVTGCFGTVAINTINKLLQNGYEVVGVDNCSTNPIFRINEIDHSTDNFTFYNNSTTDLEQIFNRHKIGKVLHTAGIIGSWVTDNDSNYFDSKFYKMLKKRAKSIEEIDKQYDETLPFVPLYDFKLNGYGDIIFTLSAPTGKGEGEGSRTPKISLSNSDKQSTQFITLCLNKIADELL